MTQLRPHLDWMLKDLADGVPGTRHVVVLTGDGLRMAQHLTDNDTADRVAAACAGLQSLSGAIAREFPGGDPRARLVVIEAAGGFFYLMAAGAGAYLAVLADLDVDPGLMGRRMRDLVARIGEHLSAPPRDERPSDERLRDEWSGAERSGAEQPPGGRITGGGAAGEVQLDESWLTRSRPAAETPVGRPSVWEPAADGAGPGRGGRAA